MKTWHVWGDYVHTLPDRIGGAKLENRDDAAARRTAEACGFNFERRTHNGFEPWAATFVADGEGDHESAFAAYPIVRGWKAL